MYSLVTADPCGVSLFVDHRPAGSACTPGILGPLSAFESLSRIGASAGTLRPCLSPDTQQDLVKGDNE